MTSFNCDRFLDKCHAACCGVFPIDKDIYERNKDKIILQPTDTLSFNQKDPFSDEHTDYILPFTPTHKCCFLRKDYKCAIYEDRPMICKKYGTQDVDTLACHWQDKEGNERTKEEKEKIDEISRSNLAKFLKKSQRG